MKSERRTNRQVGAWLFVLSLTITSCAETNSVVVESPATAAGGTDTCYAPDTHPGGDSCLDRAVPMPFGTDPYSGYDVPDSFLTQAEIDQRDAEAQARIDAILAAPTATDPPTTSATSTPSSTLPASTATTPVTTTTVSNSAVPITAAPCVFIGFFTPVDNAPVLNVTNSGAVVPVEFGFCASGTLAIFETGSPSSAAHSCGIIPSDKSEEDGAMSTSGLAFDPGSGRYKFNWETDNTWAGQCRTLTLRFTNGATETAEFEFR